MQPSHQERIVDQFSRQAIPFSQMAGHSTAEPMDLLAERCRLDGTQSILDVACGPGLVALALASRCKKVLGMDLTPAMLVRAEELRVEKGVENVSWVQGDVAHLPWQDGHFDVVVTRFSVHHFLDPASVVAEMARVCKPGGFVAVIDAATSEAANAGYNRMEKWRDPSHTRALKVRELWELCDACGLVNLRLDQYGLDMELEEQLSRSFPETGDADKLRALLKQDLADQRLELRTRETDGKLWFTYPVSQVCGQKTAPLA